MLSRHADVCECLPSSTPVCFSAVAGTKGVCPGYTFDACHFSRVAREPPEKACAWIKEMEAREAHSSPADDTSNAVVRVPGRRAKTSAPHGTDHRAATRQAKLCAGHGNRDAAACSACDVFGAHQSSPSRACCSLKRHTKEMNTDVRRKRLSYSPASLTASFPLPRLECH